MTGTDVERVKAFLGHFARAQATEAVDLSWGYVLLQSDFPLSHMHNRVVVTSKAPAADIVDRTEELMSRAGLSHRYISVDDDSLGEALKPEFVAAGYDHEAIVTMIYSGPEPMPPTHEVRAISLETLRPAVEADWRRDLPDSGSEVIDQLAGRMALYSRGAEVAFLAVFEGDGIVAHADLYLDRAAGVAQFESLVTHPDHRGRGYAGALVSEALRRGRNAGCELAFLEADLDDWPRDWYARLGYVELCRTRHFTSNG